MIILEISKLRGNKIEFRESNDRTRSIRYGTNEKEVPK